MTGTEGTGGITSRVTGRASGLSGGDRPFLAAAPAASRAPGFGETITSAGDKNPARALPQNSPSVSRAVRSCEYTAQKMPLPAAFFVESPCFEASLPSGNGCTAIAGGFQVQWFLMIILQSVKHVFFSMRRICRCWKTRHWAPFVHRPHISKYE
jgi:hypothetical protein